MGETYNWFILTKVRTRGKTPTLNNFLFFILLFLLQYSANTMKHAPIGDGQISAMLGQISADKVDNLAPDHRTI